MLLLAISPYMIWHSQDARMYAMSLALTIATVLFAAEALQRQRWPWAAAYIGAAWLALHTHYYAIFVLLALNLFVITRALFVARTRPMLQPWLLWQVVVAALYLPWFARAGVIVSAYGGNGDSPGLTHALQRALSVFAMGESAPPTQQLWWGLIAAALLIMGIFRLAAGSRDDRRTLWLLAFYLLVPLLAIWWSAQERPIFNERYLVAAAPPFYLLIGAAFHAIPVRRPARLALDATAGVLFAILVAGMMFSLNRYYTNPAFSKTRGWRELATAITRLAAGVPADRVRVAQNYPDPTLWYYYRGPVDHVVLPPSAHNQEGAISAVDALARLGVQRVIVPLQPAANWDDTGLAAAALSERFDRIAQAQVGVWPVHVYAQPASAFTPLNAVFTNGVTLRGAVLAPDKLPPGGLLAVHLDWRGDPRLLTGTEKVFVQVLDSTGQLVAQDDRPLTLTTANTSGTGAASYGILLPQELAGGPYRLIAGLYDPGQEGAPRVSTTDGADHVEIARPDALVQVGLYWARVLVLRVACSVSPRNTEHATRNTQQTTVGSLTATCVSGVLPCSSTILPCFKPLIATFRTLSFRPILLYAGS